MTNYKYCTWEQKASFDYDGCAGYKYPEECPHKGEYSSDSEACQECDTDVREAIAEAERESHLNFGKPKVFDPVTRKWKA